MEHRQALQAMRQALEALRTENLSVGSFCQTWRTQNYLLAALPPRYGEVMEDILGRMEAGSLFAEESCSFSQNDLAAVLYTWLEKAERTLSQRG